MWPEFELVRNRTGRPELVAAPSPAVIFRGCAQISENLTPGEKILSGVRLAQAKLLWWLLFVERGTSG
jgi:hypothetical protein